MKTIEELEAELETVTRERDRSLFAWESAGMTGRTAQSAMLELARQLEAAKGDLAFVLAEYANERNEELTEDALCLKIAGLTHQRDEARAEVERLTDASTHWQVMCKREGEEIERLARQVELLTDERDELLVRVANQDAELRATREVYNEARTDVPALIARVRELEAERDQALADYQDLGREMNDECTRLEKERDDARKEAAAWALRVVELARANEQLAQERAEFKLRAEDEIANNVVSLNAHRNQVERLKKLETDIRDHVSYTGGNSMVALEDLAEEVRKTWVRVDDECIKLRSQGTTWAAQSFSQMLKQERQQMREYGLSYEGVRKVLREHDDGEISFGKLMDLIRAAARAMAEDMKK